MSCRTIGAALAALATLAVPATASAPPVTSGTWVPTSVTAVTFPTAAAFASGTGFVTAGVTHDGTNVRHALLTTTDHGRTWSVDPHALRNGSVAFSTETEWWSYSGAGLERTTDAGATWNAVSRPLAAGEHAGGIVRIAAGGGGMATSAAMAPSPGGCATHDALFFTGDGGATWERHDFPAYASGGGKVHSVDVASDDTAVAVLWNTVTGCGNAESAMDVYVTTDSGATWTRVIASPATGPQVHDAAISADGSTVVVAYNDGTVRWSTDGGTTFASAVLRYPLLEPLPDPWTGAHDAVTDVEIAGDAWYAVLNGGSVHRSTDGGATWAVDGLHGVFGFTVLAAFDADRAVTASPGLVATRLP